MNYYKKLTLLQNLASKIDDNKASQFEVEAFDIILEMLHEQNKIRNADSGHSSSGPTSEFKPGLKFAPGVR